MLIILVTNLSQNLKISKVLQRPFLPDLVICSIFHTTTHLEDKLCSFGNCSIMSRVIYLTNIIRHGTNKRRTSEVERRLQKTISDYIHLFDFSFGSCGSMLWKIVSATLLYSGPSRGPCSIGPWYIPFLVFSIAPSL